MKKKADGPAERALELIERAEKLEASLEALGYHQLHGQIRALRITLEDELGERELKRLEDG